MKLVVQPELKGDADDPTAQIFEARVFFAVGISWVVASVMFYPGLGLEGEPRPLVILTPNPHERISALPSPLPPPLLMCVAKCLIVVCVSLLLPFLPVIVLLSIILPRPCYPPS